LSATALRVLVVSGEQGVARSIASSLRGRGHDVAVVVQSKPRHAWFSGGNVIHRGAALNLESGTVPSDPGAPIVNARRELVGIKVITGRRPGRFTAVSIASISNFLQSAGLR